MMSDPNLFHILLKMKLLECSSYRASTLAPNMSVGVCRCEATDRTPWDAGALLKGFVQALLSRLAARAVIV